jgi:hypothetical protein
MVERHFTPDEANALLEQVRPVAESLVAHLRKWRRLRSAGAA